MSISRWQRRFLVAVAVAAGYYPANTQAVDSSGLEAVVVQSAYGEDEPSVMAAPEAAPIPVESAAPMEEPAAPAPIVDYNAMADSYSATPCSCCNSTCCTKKKKEAATAAMKGAYKGVFYANDFSYLNDPCYDGPSFHGDALKGLFDGALDVGGEARVRYHSERNHRGLGITGRDDEFFLTRIRAFANWRINDNFRFYGEFLYADSGGETFNNRPIEENRGEAQNLFVDVKLLDGLTTRFGRQELLLGAQRLVSPLDWANTRRTFDGIRTTYKQCDNTVDLFWTKPVNRNFANEDRWDDTNEDVDFFGAYLSRANTPLGTWDSYYIGLNNDAADFSYHTLGSRVVGKTDGGYLYEYEGGTQFGENGDGSDHSAGFITGGLGRQIALGDWKPTVWMWYDFASGGDDNLRAGDGFDHLFPLAHKYNGFMDLFGRRNLHDINAQFIAPVFGTNVKMLVWYHYFLLDELTTPFNVTMTPFSAAPAGDRELGHEIDLIFNITLDPRTSALLGYSHFSAGDYYATTAGVQDLDADFFYFQLQKRF